MSDYRMGFKRCRQLERATRRATFKRVLVVVAVVAACIGATLALWQWYPRTAFGATRNDKRLMLAQIGGPPLPTALSSTGVIEATPQGVNDEQR